MTLDLFLEYCHAKPGTTSSYPFKGEAVWMKVLGKMYALANVMPMTMGDEYVEAFHFINLKCEPQRALELREQWPSIRPGWHQSKVHWNSLIMDGSLSDTLICELIDHSYTLVANSLTRKQKDELRNLG